VTVWERPLTVSLKVEFIDALGNAWR